ncbi:hypothetical protein N5C16_03080 [Stenotrophomonas sp. GD03908]|uniref:Uncharacterized protein n=1 Tax=Stenotrophomonas maltophilia TaxID=40324 RepID=A0AAJ2WLL0_STEMA|nr:MULTISPECIES: hypothetical protein [Stenotrophomonas]MDH0978248.1 hypothetical protein [Stenotrophomonas sp. GD03908]MDQ7292967.1 hypothetical protein [Stenotrophomonas sp. Sm0041]MDZ5763526.1 hypothetical protein [Stenotrophomonas maltophilia]
MAIFQSPSHHHGFMGNGTDTERNIDSVFNQIDAPFGGVHLQLNVRVLQLEPRQLLPPRLERRWK